MAQTVEGVKQCFRAAEDSGKKFRCDINSLYNLCLLKGRLFSVLSTEGLTLPLETPTTRFAKVGIVLRIHFGSFVLFCFAFFCFPLFFLCFLAGEVGQVQQVQSISRDSPLPPISYLRHQSLSMLIILSEKD